MKMTEEERKKRRYENQKKYRNFEKGKATNKRYKERTKEHRQQYLKEYNKKRKETEKGLEYIREHRQIYNKKYYARTAYKYPTRAWADWEDKLIIDHELTDRELSDKLQRSVGAIQNRRHRLKARYQALQSVTTKK